MLAEAERVRGRDRLARLPTQSRLRDYELRYGLELGAGTHGLAHDDADRIAIEPYPASVRARRLAVALRFGRTGLGAALTRAARAVALQIELHLLGNHLLENAFALVCAGSAMLGREADAWFRVGSWLLDWQLPEQFLADGGHFERSASYHLALTHALLETIEIAEASGRGARAEWRKTAARALAFASAIRAPDGTYPLFNDAALDAAPALDAVVAFGRSLGLAPPPPAEQPATPWLKRLEPTGWILCGAGDAWLALDAGPDGARWQPGHTHADGLAFELWIAGERVVVDHGVASYGWDAARTASRSTRVHNTIELAGLDSCEVWGAFRLGRRGRGFVQHSHVDATAVDLTLAHDGYQWLGGKPTLRRTLRLEASALTVRDWVEASSGCEPLAFVSRLRFDAGRFDALRATGTGSVDRSDGVWFPRLSAPAQAIVLSQESVIGAAPVEWRLVWGSPVARSFR